MMWRFATTAHSPAVQSVSLISRTQRREESGTVTRKLIVLLQHAGLLSAERLRALCHNVLLRRGSVEPGSRIFNSDASFTHPESNITEPVSGFCHQS